LVSAQKSVDFVWCYWHTGRLSRASS